MNMSKAVLIWVQKMFVRIEVLVKLVIYEFSNNLETTGKADIGL